MKGNNELSLVELQRILLARCNFSLCVSHKFSMERVLAFLFRARSSSTEILAFPQHSICVPVMRSLLGYFRPVLYISFTYHCQACRGGGGGDLTFFRKIAVKFPTPGQICEVKYD